MAAGCQLASLRRKRAAYGRWRSTSLHVGALTRHCSPRSGAARPEAWVNSKGDHRAFVLARPLNTVEPTEFVNQVSAGAARGRR